MNYDRFSYFVWVPFACFLVGYTIAYFFFHQTSFPVPTIIGKKIQEGMEIVASDGLGLRLYAQKEDSSVAPGVVLDQYPRPGQYIRPNQDIFVTIATRPGAVSMLDISGRKIDVVEQDFEEKEISLKTVHLHSSYPLDMCIAQSPFPGVKLPEKRATVYVSDGKIPLYVVPSVIGMSVLAVEEICKNQKIRVEIFHVQPQDANHSCDQCLVVSQYPAPGAIVNVSSTVLVQLQVENRG